MKKMRLTVLLAAMLFAGAAACGEADSDRADKGEQTDNTFGSALSDDETHSHGHSWGTETVFIPTALKTG